MFNYIKRFYKKMSIKQKLLLLFSVQIIIPMAFMGMMFYKNTESIIQNKSVSYSADLLKMIELRMNDFSSNLVSITDDILYDAKMYAILDEKKSEVATEDLRDYCYNLLRRICLSNKEIQSITLASLNEYEYSYDLNAGGVSIESSASFKAMLEKARLAQHKPTWYTEVDEENKVRNLYLIRMIYDSDDFSERGLIILQINRQRLKDVYNDLSTEFMQSINILSKDNKWIIGTEEDWYNEEENEWISNQADNWGYRIDKKEQRLLAFMNIEGTEWKIVAEGSLNQLVNEEMGHFRFLFIIVMTFTILLLSIFSILMAMDILSPINRLVHSIKKVEEENIHQEVIVDREDELGYLSKCFNKMSKEIDNLLNRVYKEELTRREAELKALQAQINPHFLFNTLESINWMAQLNNVPEIRDMVTSLGALIEASIGKGSPMVPLSKELKYIDSYLLIMKNRYGERLSYESDIDTSLLGQEVPKLILQPLIENAIYHGIDKMRKKGTIKLTIRREDETIYIEIMDNGKGMLPEEVEDLNQKFKEDRDDYILGDNRKSIGLANVNGRVKLFFGKDYGLQIESEYETYTKMKLYLPIRD
ncbi:cache domain-containing sensor histidine kinase [Cellulosilyticum lentocellum]|uniref:histidine kinase n=1 Tax=Cellulosilyticum lentocellum (strain ATCC 49066 / DSM 5427 / NCIMB 11756 / RHM5) TaxID=642492 RepID=F2JQA1_CELLD|nr:sensor histidine kinase [Cellulosilyticum lentocellum]ADZ83763.1 integral membrane sensor signal transduction histidine kinase [Cellulosilyticum lentocellum DSM 5427]